MSLDIAKLEQLKGAQEWGPPGASAMAKGLRALIRERRKAKQPHEDLLHALYGTCMIADLAASLAFEGMQPHAMTQFVDINELQATRCNYATMGYQCSESLSKTDVKWLVEAFGEPVEHQSFDAVWPHIRRNAISRYCRGELRSANATARSLGLAQQTMEQWLRELVARNLKYHKEWQQTQKWKKTKEWQQIRDLRQKDWQERREAQLAELKLQIEAAMTATQTPFAVADIETTGLKAHSAEIIELAAILVKPDGSVTSEFSMLVKARNHIPTEITQLTGITQAELDANGEPPAEALSAFFRHIGNRPVFFHNAPFDRSFLGVASAANKLKFKNTVHDTLPVARRAWPYLGTYKLSALAEHVGVSAPKHRALGDSHAALAVLLAARNKIVR